MTTLEADQAAADLIATELSGDRVSTGLYILKLAADPEQAANITASLVEIFHGHAPKGRIVTHHLNIPNYGNLNSTQIAECANYVFALINNDKIGQLAVANCWASRTEDLPHETYLIATVLHILTGIIVDNVGREHQSVR